MPETAAAEKDLFYWLHENGFYPPSSVYTFCHANRQNTKPKPFKSQNLSACSLYRYEPFSVLPTSAGTAKNRLAPSAVKTSGWNGEREYSYHRNCKFFCDFT